MNSQVNRQEYSVAAYLKEITPNSYLSRLVWTDNLFEHTRRLIEGADCFIAMDPRTGMLCKVVGLRTMPKAGMMDAKDLYPVGPRWKAILTGLHTTIIHRLTEDRGRRGRLRCQAPRRFERRRSSTTLSIKSAKATPQMSLIPQYESRCR